VEKMWKRIASEKVWKTITPGKMWKTSRKNVKKIE
jgi:hypothetical protein